MSAGFSMTNVNHNARKRNLLILPNIFGKVMTEQEKCTPHHKKKKKKKKKKKTPLIRACIFFLFSALLNSPLGIAIWTYLQKLG